jgi:IS5 family transposase
MNKIEEGIMHKATTGTELTEYEKERNKAISKVRYIVERYFGLSHLYNKASRERFPKLITNALDALLRQMAFNLFRASRILKTA